MKNWRTTLERVEKFVSPRYFTDCNLRGRCGPLSGRRPSRPRASVFLPRGKPKLPPPRLRDKVPACCGHGRDRGEKAGRLCYGATIAEVDQGIARPTQQWVHSRKAGLERVLPGPSRPGSSEKAVRWLRFPAS